MIVGGVAGGASAATRARRMNEHAEIILLEKDEYVSFANCGLPYYIGGEIAERQKLLVATPQFLARRFRLDVRTRQEVQRIDRAAKTVTVLNHASGETYQLAYDKLILAPGAAPLVPPLPGGDAANVFTLRNMEDTDRIKAAADACSSETRRGGRLRLHRAGDGRTVGPPGLPGCLGRVAAAGPAAAGRRDGPAAGRRPAPPRRDGVPGRRDQTDPDRRPQCGDRHRAAERRRVQADW